MTTSKIHKDLYSRPQALHNFWYKSHCMKRRRYQQLNTILTMWWWVLRFLAKLTQQNGLTRPILSLPISKGLISLLNLTQTPLNSKNSTNVTHHHHLRMEDKPLSSSSRTSVPVKEIWILNLLILYP
jgi:hypothetical protein